VREETAGGRSKATYTMLLKCGQTYTCNKYEYFLMQAPSTSPGVPPPILITVIVVGSDSTTKLQACVNNRPTIEQDPSDPAFDPFFVALYASSRSVYVRACVRVFVTACRC
jgi:hypothetical protein